ncbi:MAG: TerB family tellurite resistance protein [Spirosomataceae bacterium]
MKNLTPNLYIGLGSAVYALIKSDGQLHDPSSINARMALIEVPNGEMAMQSFQIREHYQTPAEEAYSFALRCFSTHRKELNANVKKFFVKLLKKIAKADNHISNKEVAFINRFQRDLQRI